jgi:hypothetical protein
MRARINQFAHASAPEMKPNFLVTEHWSTWSGRCVQNIHSCRVYKIERVEGPDRIFLTGLTLPYHFLDLRISFRPFGTYISAAQKDLFGRIVIKKQAI